MDYKSSLDPVPHVKQGKLTLKIALDQGNNVGRHGYVPLWLEKSNTKWRCAVIMAASTTDRPAYMMHRCYVMEHPHTKKRAIIFASQVNFY